MAKFFKVDIHTHIMPAEMPDFMKEFGYGGFITLDHHKEDWANMKLDTGKFFREVYCNTWDPQKRIEECDQQGVDIQVLSVIPVLFSYWAKAEDGLRVSIFLNNHIAELVENNPKRFVGLGTLPMQAPELAVKELERCKEIGLSGVEIGTHVNDWNLDDKIFFPVYQRAEEIGMAIFVHPWDMMGKSRMEKYWLPWLVGMPAETSLAIASMIFGGVFERFPNLRVAFAHGGGSFPATIARIEHGFNVRPDLVAIDNDVNPREYLGKFWIDSLVHDPIMLKYLVDLIGADKVALGSDYPFPLGEHRPGSLIESSDFDDETKSKLLGLSALKWLGLDKSKFL